MPTIDLGEAAKAASENEFWAVRGKAIQAYANLEQSLARLFQALSGTDHQIASAIFFGITSADSRNKILEKLFRKKFNADFNLFRNSLFRQLQPVTAARNEIVHWSAINEVSHDGEKTISNLVLMPPSFWAGDFMTAPKLKIDDLRAFISKCGFYSALINMFAMIEGRAIEHSLSEVDLAPWRHIFSEAIVYPPSSEHPLIGATKSEGGETHTFALK